MKKPTTAEIKNKLRILEASQLFRICDAARNIEKCNTNTYHTFLQTLGNLYRKDRFTEWWTITDEARFYDHRHTIPFRTLYCHTGRGGLVVYLDHPEVTP